MVEISTLPPDSSCTGPTGASLTRDWGHIGTGMADEFGVGGGEKGCALVLFDPANHTDAVVVGVWVSVCGSLEDPEDTWPNSSASQKRHCRCKHPLTTLLYRRSEAKTTSRRRRRPRSV